MKPPPCSIVIPTRNRARLLPAAIRSALRQTEPRFELVVSDNASEDETPSVVAAAADHRLRYVRTPRALPMHDSWQFALEQARGELVTILCDDDALHPATLELACHHLDATGADVVSWRSCSFLDDDWPEPSERGRVRFGPPFSGRRVAIDGPILLDDAHSLRVTCSELVPKFLNCLVTRTVIDRVAADGARFFHPSCPDYSAMAVLAAYAGRMIMLDVPLLVVGAMAESIGASAATRGQAARRYVEELLAAEPNMVRPPVLGPPVTWIAQTFLQCGRDVPRLRGRSVDEVHLLGIAGLEIEAMDAAGVPVDDFRAAYDAALARCAPGQASAIRAFRERRPLLESEAFLRPGGAAATSVGEGRALLVPDASARALGASSIDGVAAALDGWCAANGRGLADLWDRLLARAGSRSIVLFGLGLNGRALLRALPDAGHPVHARLRWLDDRAERGPRTPPRLDRFESLDAGRHYVLVTPTAGDAIVERLATRGFDPERDVETLHDAGGEDAAVEAAGRPRRRTDARTLTPRRAGR